MIKKIALFGTIILFSFLLIYCTTDEEKLIGPYGNSDKYLTVVNLSSDKTTVYSNGDVYIVSIKVLDVDNSPAIGLKVDFTSEFGSITEFDITDSSGIAFATFTSDENTGANIITVDTGIKKYTLTIEVVSYQPRYIELFSESRVVLADGISSTTITAVLKDSVGNLMPEITVNFETDLGTLSSHVEQTDISGIAKTELTSTNYEGTATITATSFLASYIKVEFKESVPVFAEISSDSTKLLADGISETKIIAKVYDSANKVIPGAVFDFSTNLGSLDYAEGVRANQEGEAEVTFTSSGSAIDTTVIIKAVVAADKSISEEISIKLRGITSITYIDSTNMSDYGIYKAYIRTHLRETTSGKSISDGAVYFSAPVGTMNYPLVEIDEQGTAESVFNIEVLPINQNNIIITSELSSAPEVFSATNVLTVPGAELLVSTIDDVIMGDSEGYALVKATLRESDGNVAIPFASITWTTTMGTIIGTSSTNSIGNTIDTLVIESAVNQAANITVTANFGDYVSDNEVLTFIPPVNDNRLILGFEPDTTDLGIVPCDLYNSIAIKEGGISALFVSGNGYGIPGEEIHFSIVPNNFAAICSVTYTRTNGVAMVMFAYPPQSSGQIIRVWGEAFDGTKGSIDIILP